MTITNSNKIKEENSRLLAENEDLKRTYKRARRYVKESLVAIIFSMEVLMYSEPIKAKEQDFLFDVRLYLQSSVNWTRLRQDLVLLCRSQCHKSLSMAAYTNCHYHHNNQNTIPSFNESKFNSLISNHCLVGFIDWSYKPHLKNKG